MAYTCTDAGNTCLSYFRNLFCLTLSPGVAAAMQAAPDRAGSTLGAPTEQGVLAGTRMSPAQRSLQL